MAEEDKVKEVREGVYSVPYHYIGDAKTVLVDEEEYAICTVPGITTHTLADVGVYEHKKSTLSTARELVRARAIFRIVQEDGYTVKGNLISVVEDVGLARKILDAFKEQEEAGREEED